MNTSGSMHEAINTFILNRKVKKEEALLTTKLAKEKDGGLNKILIKVITSSGNSLDSELKKITDRKKPKEENSFDFHLKRYADLSALAETHAIDVTEFRAEYNRQMLKVTTDHQCAVWLDKNCENAEYVSVATHVSKLTHSSNKGTSFIDSTDEVSNSYLTTSSMSKPIVDGTYETSAYSPMVLLLLVENKGRFFYEDIIQGNFEGLEGFTEDQQQLESWKHQLKKSIQKPDKSTDSLSKQVYFPVREQPEKSDDWHLLSVLVSSSLAHDIFSRTGAKDFNEKYRSKSLYSIEQVTDFPNKATLMVTQSSHQNPSILNGKRSGRLFLLPSTPPTWKSQLKPPIQVKSWFYSGVPMAAYKADVEHLSSFLLRFDRIGISTRDPKKRDWLLKWGSRILSSVMFYAEAIQHLPAGWSDATGIKLKREQQYFLDPYRVDTAFQSTKGASDWEKVIASDFAQWLNRKIQEKDKKFTPQREHTQLWKTLMLDQLREHNEMVKAVLANTSEGVS